MTNLILPAIFSGSLWEIVATTSGFGLFILLVLIFMSMVSWSIIFNKWKQFKRVEQQTGQFLSYYKRSKKLSESVGQAKTYGDSPVANIYSAGIKELAELSQSKNEGGELQQSLHPLEEREFEIVEMTMERAMSDELGKLERQVVFLATTGNSAPFMGLLGTVVRKKVPKKTLQKSRRQRRKLRLWTQLQWILPRLLKRQQQMMPKMSPQMKPKAAASR